MKLNVLRADPAGNITLFVLDPIERERRAALAAELMRRLPDMKIDQVGFACPADADTDGRMEMMGGEFCGPPAPMRCTSRGSGAVSPK